MTDCTKKGPLYCSICDAKDQRIRELEDEIKRYKRIVPGTPATESQWLALVTRAETAEQRIRELEQSAAKKDKRVRELPARGTQSAIMIGGYWINRADLMKALADDE